MGRPSASDRYRRLVSIIPWIAANDGPTIDEVCERFGVSRENLLADLDVVFMVGLYPYTPDELVDLVIDDDRVWVRYAPFFERPLRLTPEQALSLVTTSSGLLAVPGAESDGPLARGLQKVADVLGVDPAKIKPLAPADDCRQDFRRLRRREDELHVGRGLFERF